MQFLSLKSCAVFRMLNLLLLNVFLLHTVHAVINLPKNVTIPAVFVFGDSVVDTGNNNYIVTIAKVNFPPYGQDFMGGCPTGRFSNGKVPADMFVEELGIKELLPPYLDPTLKDEDLITGVNFASGGAGYDPLTSELAEVISLPGQIELLEEYIKKLKGIVGEERTNTILSNSLFMLIVGSNDLTNAYLNNPIRRLRYDDSSYTDFMLQFASAFFQDLYRLGARRIGAFGVPPIGCLPSQRTLAGGPQRKCVDKYNQVAVMFNSKLSALSKSLNTKLPQARMVYIDIYDLPLDIIHNPIKYGFEIANKGCCGTGTIEVAFICKYTCPNVYEYVFWDSFHLTEKGYRLLVTQLLQKSIYSFF